MAEPPPQPQPQPEPDPPPEPSRQASRALLFRTLSLLFIFPSLGAIAILVTGEQDPSTPGSVATASHVRLEEWIAAGLLGIHGAFLYLAWAYRKKERAE